TFLSQPAHALSKDEAVSFIKIMTKPQPPKFLDGSLPRSDEKEAVFVAREQVLRQLDRFLQQIVGGRGKVVFVTGDAGSGKTALIREFTQRALVMHPEILVTYGDCNALTGIGDPYLPFREALGVLTGDLEQKWVSGCLRREQAQQLWANIPLSVQSIVEEGPDLIDTFLSGTALLTRGKAYNPEKVEWLHPLEELINRKAAYLATTGPEQKDLFTQYTKVFQVISLQQPILLVLDDLQWADLGSISLLFHLGRKIEDSRILILGAFRSSEITG
ncbi:unnamed protein product, partial [marine sediment metagenome]